MVRVDEAEPAEEARAGPILGVMAREEPVRSMRERVLDDGLGGLSGIAAPPAVAPQVKTELAFARAAGMEAGRCTR